MKKNKVLSAFIGGTLAICMILSIGISAFADDSNDASTLKDSLSNSRNKEWRKGGMRHEKRFDFDSTERHEKMETKLNSLVENGTLTEENVNNILEFLNKKHEERKAEFEKIKAMTAEERRVYFEENKPQKPDLMNELVEEGIITQEQADKIVKVIPKHKKDLKRNKGMFHHDNPEKQEKMKEALDQLVDNGIFTNEQVNEIQDFITKKTEERKAEFEKIKSMTAEERKEYFEENKPQRTNLTKELVEEGIITQEQADELLKILPKRGKHFKGFDRK